MTRIRTFALILCCAPLALASCQASDEATEGATGTAVDEPLASPPADLENDATPAADAAGAAPEGTTPTAGAAQPTTVASAGASPLPPPGATIKVPPTRPSDCGADKVSGLFGQQDSPDIRARAVELVKHTRIRWLMPDSVVTMDFSANRLNMELNETGKVLGAHCG